jgi:tetratricopeptide (TPR) repeat protein
MRERGVRSVILLAIASLLVSVLWPSPARAQTAQQYFDQAEAAGRRGAYDEAIALYTKALDASPTLLEALRRRGVTRRWAKAFDAARDDLDRYISRRQLDASGYASRADLFLDTGDNAGALRDANKAVALDPASFGALNSRGRAHSRLNQKDEALADYTLGILVKPDDAMIWNNRGFVRRDLGDRDGAMKDFEKALSLNPNLANAKRGIESLKIAAGTSAPPPLPGDASAPPGLPPPPPLDPPGAAGTAPDPSGVRWSPEQREELVLSLLRGDLTPGQAAAKHALGLGVMTQWYDAFLAGGRAALRTK